jgi:hypothetical protein
VHHHYFLLVLLLLLEQVLDLANQYHLQFLELVSELVLVLEHFD